MTKLWSTYFLDPNVQPSFKGGEGKTNVVAIFFFFFFEPKS
jgi:hypothetical protein